MEKKYETSSWIDGWTVSSANISPHIQGEDGREGPGTLCLMKVSEESDSCDCETE